MSAWRSAIARVGAELLGLTEAGVVSDEGPYAALASLDEGFRLFLQMNTLDAIDWNAGVFTRDDPDGLYGRSDFRLEGSLFEEPPNSPEHVSRQARAQHGFLFGEQLLQAGREGVLPSDDLAGCIPYLARIEGGDTLVEALEALFGVGRFHLQPEASEVGFEVDPPWRRVLDAIEPADVRHHFEMFFQTTEGARSQGLHWEGAANELVIPGYRPLMRWEGGEGYHARYVLAAVNPAE